MFILSINKIYAHKNGLKCQQMFAYSSLWLLALSFVIVVDSFSWK